MQLHKTTTETLIETYHMERLMEQERIESQEYGSLFVRAYFNHDSLCVEVLQARNVIPLDPNGKEMRWNFGVYRWFIEWARTLIGRK